MKHTEAILLNSAPLGNCYSLTLAKCWLQFKKLIYSAIYYNVRHSFVPYGGGMGGGGRRARRINCQIHTARQTRQDSAVCVVSVGVNWVLRPSGKVWTGSR